MFILFTKRISDFFVAQVEASYFTFGIWIKYCMTLQNYRWCVLGYLLSCIYEIYADYNIIFWKIKHVITIVCVGFAIFDAIFIKQKQWKLCNLKYKPTPWPQPEKLLVVLVYHLCQWGSSSCCTGLTSFPCGSTNCWTGLSFFWWGSASCRTGMAFCCWGSIICWLFLHFLLWKN